nr:MAG TPA: hypothetical protein [Caudoviricetes sp.]
MSNPFNYINNSHLNQTVLCRNVLYIHFFNIISYLSLV